MSAKASGSVEIGSNGARAYPVSVGRSVKSGVRDRASGDTQKPNFPDEPSQNGFVGHISGLRCWSYVFRDGLSLFPLESNKRTLRSGCRPGGDPPPPTPASY